MRARFYPEVFSQRGISAVIPGPVEQEYIHTRYMDELVILGGTELPLLLRDIPIPPVPFLDTTSIHARALVAEMLS